MLIGSVQVRAPDNAESDLPTIREWIAANYEIARTLEQDFHRSAERDFPTGNPLLEDTDYLKFLWYTGPGAFPARPLVERGAYIRTLSEREPRELIAENGDKFVFTITPVPDINEEAFTIQATVGGRNVGYVDTIGNTIKYGFPKSRLEEILFEDDGPGIAAIGTDLGAEYRGVGRALMVMAMQVAKDNGHTNFLAMKSNADSVGFYRWLGFKGDIDLEFDFLTTSLPDTTITVRKLDIAGYLKAMRNNGRPENSKTWARIFNLSEDKTDIILRDLVRAGMLVDCDTGAMGILYLLSKHLSELSGEQIDKVCSLIMSGDNAITDWAAFNMTDKDVINARITSAVIHEENMELTPAIPHGKVLWHVIDNELIPEMQQSLGFITRVNQMSSRLNGPERILVLNKGEKMEEVIAGLSADLNNIVHAVSHSENIDNIPEGIKVAIVTGELGDYTQLEGIMAISRALDIEDIPVRNNTLRRLYRVLTREEFDGELPAIPDDHKALAKAIVFILPKTVVENYKELKTLNENLLQLIMAA